MNEARQTADRCRTATESEQENLVAFLEVPEDELVALNDVLRETATCNVAARLSPSGAEPLVVERDLSPRAVKNDVEQLEDVGVVVGAAFLTRAVREHYDVLPHILSL